jgi:imidazolonepropionase-like amidohydrolase
MLDALESLGAVGIKVPLERGFGSDEVFPIHSPDLRAAIARQAAERGLPIYVHASDEVEQTLGLEMKAHALAHTNFAGKEPSADFPSRVVRSGAYMITTFSCIDAGLARWQPARLQDALVKVAVPAEERSTAASSDAWAALDRSELGHAFPDTPAIALRLFAWLSPPQEEPEKEALEVNLRAARRLHVEGVPLVIGSDAGNSSVLSQFHGTSTIRELELLSRAGVANAAVLDAATRVAARMLGIEADAGVIEPGRRGDLVVLDGDPLVDMSAMRRIRWTIKEGVARTPRQWMASSTRPPAPGG